MLTKSTEGLNENNKNYIEFTASGIQKGFKNQAYDGIYMEAGKPYKVSLFAKKGTYAERIKASVYSGGTLAAQTTVADNLTDIWTKYEATIVPDKTPMAVLPIRRAERSAPQAASAVRLAATVLPWAEDAPSPPLIWLP